MEAKDVDLPGHVNSLVRYQLVQVNNKALYSINPYCSENNLSTKITGLLKIMHKPKN